MGIHSRDEELQAESARFFVRLGIVVVIIALVVAVSGCVCIVEIPPFDVDCKRLFER